MVAASLASSAVVRKGETTTVEASLMRFVTAAAAAKRLKGS